MTHDSDTLVLALVILGGATKNRNNAICVMPPKVAKASKAVVQNVKQFRYKHCQCKHAIIVYSPQQEGQSVAAYYDDLASHTRQYRSVVYTHWW
jgi:hypothetical protein